MRSTRLDVLEMQFLVVFESRHVQLLVGVHNALSCSCFGGVITRLFVSDRRHELHSGVRTDATGYMPQNMGNYVLCYGVIDKL